MYEDSDPCLDHEVLAKCNGHVEVDGEEMLGNSCAAAGEQEYTYFEDDQRQGATYSG